MKPSLTLALLFVVAFLLAGCFSRSEGGDSVPSKDNQQQNTARTEVSAEYDAVGLGEPDLARIFLERGSVFAALSQTHRAIEHFDEAIILDPVFADAYFARGMANIELGQLQRAIQDFDRALQISPVMAQAHVGRGRAFIALGMRQLALQDFTDAIRLSPGFAAELDRITFEVTYCPPLDSPNSAHLDC